jgi:hypothetical protein
MIEIGSQIEAAQALQIANDWCVDGWKPIPAGWEYVGQGTTREGWLSPSGVVFKPPSAQIPKREEGIRHNRLEAERFAGWEGRSFVPIWELYEVEGQPDGSVPVMAMEYLVSDGTKPDNLEEMLAALREVDAEDRHEDNWRVRGGRAILIDAAGAPTQPVPSYIPPQKWGKLQYRLAPAAAPSSTGPLPARVVNNGRWMSALVIVFGVLIAALILLPLPPSSATVAVTT